MLFDLKGKTVLVVGLAKSGVAVSQYLAETGAQVLANDIKDEIKLYDTAKKLSSIGVKLYLNESPDKLVSQADLIVISPGVPIDSPFVKQAHERNVEVLSEIELAYRFCKAPIIAVTGTNGKTTTTTLTGEIMKSSGRRTHVVGNIGTPFISKVNEIMPEDIVVAEISSFQLEAVRSFHPFACAILNITEDHLNRHGTLENYINAKARIFENSSKGDFVILNADDSIVRELTSRIESETLFFSRKKKLDKGAWIEKDMVTMDIGSGKKHLCNVEDLLIPGEHNIENALAAVLLTAVAKVSSDDIIQTLKQFRGVEHRIELVDSFKGVTFYNDSKGTNPDASIKAIKAMKGPTVLIAGGSEKGSDFRGLVNSFGSTVIHLVVLGETADKIAQTAHENRFDSVTRANNLEEAVCIAYKAAIPGGNVLLSPACASWDMFTDFEHRGRVFKESVRKLRSCDEQKDN